MNKKVHFIVSQAIIASLYIVLTLVLGAFSFNAIQLRISEVLILLCFYKKEYIYGLSLGTFIANLFSPILVYDITLGLLASILSMIAISKSKNIYIASIFPIVFNALFVGLSLHFAFELPFFLSALEVALGEFLAMIIAVILFKILERNDKFIKMIKFERNTEV